MNLHPDSLFHIYNRGNNGQNIFFNRENHLFFLRKVRNYLIPHLNFLAWCLMPNHFHWLVHVPANANLGQISKGLQVTLSSYSRAVNIQEGRVGSLFEQNTHSRLLDSTDYATTCFHYIHQNPVRRKLVERMEDWELSSFRDYIGLRTGTLVNKQLAIEWLDIPIATEDFYTEAYGVLDEEILRGLGMA